MSRLDKIGNQTIRTRGDETKTIVNRIENKIFSWYGRSFKNRNIFLIDKFIYIKLYSFIIYIIGL